MASSFAPMLTGREEGGRTVCATQTDPISVLIVDDQRSICRLIAKELSEQGFDCHTAADGRAAMEQLDSRRFKLLITDISLPGLSGLELLAYARDHCPECRTVLITGAGSRDHLAQALMLGACDYLLKPVDAGELVEAARRAMRTDDEVPALPARAAEAIEMRTQVRQASLDSVTALVRAVEAKDSYTRRHSEQVAHYAVNLAGVLGLPAPAVGSVRMASLLHDVGKIGVPDRILTKVGPLIDEEFEHIRRHPALGAEIIASITLFRTEAQLVRHHHEGWDGKGYPDGLTGEESPFVSRIICVADSIDAMLMERTYKEGYSVEKMIGELERCAGTQFDPRIAAAAVGWCRANPTKLILPKQADSRNRRLADTSAKGM